MVKSLPASAGDLRGVGSIPGAGRSLQKGKAAPSSVLAWRVPWTEQLQSADSHRSTRSPRFFPPTVLSPAAAFPAGQLPHRSAFQLPVPPRTPPSVFMTILAFRASRFYSFTPSSLNLSLSHFPTPPAQERAKPPEPPRWPRPGCGGPMKKSPR